jgi:hypothetical protein
MEHTHYSNRMERGKAQNSKGVVERVKHIAGNLDSKKLSHPVARGIDELMEQGRMNNTA